jgi:septum formation protein
MMAITLASTSAIRAELLRAACVSIDVAAPQVDESALKAALVAQGAAPKSVADALAEAKAVKLSSRRAGLVIGADSTLELDGQLYDKPLSMAEARTHLLAYRGRPHRLHAAVVIAEGGAPVWRHLSTARLTVRDFSDAFLDHYLAQEGEALLSSVGCYRLEGLGAQLFTQIDGDYFSILGLPLLPILDYLRTRRAIAA